MSENIPNCLQSSFSFVQKEQKAVCISTWNVNSIKARLPVLTSYLQDKTPDVVMLQEIKTETKNGFFCLPGTLKRLRVILFITVHIAVKF